MKTVKQTVKPRATKVAAAISKMKEEFNNPEKLVIDEYAELYNKLAADVDRLAKLKKTIDKMAAADLSDYPVSLLGYRHAIDFSAPCVSNICKVSAEEFVGMTGQWDALSVSVTKAKELLTEAEMEELFEKARGSRRFKRIR